MKILVLLFFLISTSVLAQFKLPENEAGQVQYQELVRMPNGKLVSRLLVAQAHLWISQYYDSDVEQQFDQEHNILFVKSSYKIDNQSIRYTLTIEIKLGRYRATITDLIADNNGISLPIRPTSPTVEEMSRASSPADRAKNAKVIQQTAAQLAALYQQLDKDCHATLASLKEAMLAINAK